MTTYNPETKKGKFEVSFQGFTKTYTAIDEAQARYNFAKEFVELFPLTLTVMSDGRNTYMKRDMTNFNKISVKKIKPTERENG